MKPLEITLTRDGRPLNDAAVAFEGAGAGTTDAAGVIEITLPVGRVRGAVTLSSGEQAHFALVNAHGLRRIRVAVAGNVEPLDDPAARAAMPSDRYEPLAWLGAGAMGRVLKARDTQLDRIVAVKVLKPELAASPQDLEFFVAEGRGLARVRHPNLLEVYDLGVNAGVPYLVVQFVDGPDLHNLVDSGGPMPIHAVCAAGAQLASALDALHQAGMVHRDVKPSNGLVDHAGHVVLADFGLVRALDEVADPRSLVFGTPGYMSPEHLQGQPLGPATDVYALGATLFHLVTGQIPFDGPKLMWRHVHDERPDARERRPETPPELAGLIRSMMAIAPEDRPTAQDIAAELRASCADWPIGVLGPFYPRLRGAASDPARPAASAAPGSDPARPAASVAPESDPARPAASAAPGSDPAPPAAPATPASDPLQVVADPQERDQSPGPSAPYEGADPDSDSLAALTGSERRRARRIGVFVLVAVAVAVVLMTVAGGPTSEEPGLPAGAGAPGPGEAPAPVPARAPEPRGATEGARQGADPGATPRPASGSEPSGVSPGAAAAVGGNAADPPGGVDTPAPDVAAAEAAAPERPAPAADPADSEPVAPSGAATGEAARPERRSTADPEPQPRSREPRDEAPREREAPPEERSEEPVVGPAETAPAAEPVAPAPTPPPAPPVAAPAAPEPADPSPSGPSAAPSEDEEKPGDSTRRRRDREVERPPIGF